MTDGFSGADLNEIC